MNADRWIERIFQGDSQALDELVEAFYPEILRYCLWHAPNPSLAEDAAQETFLKAIRYLDRYSHKGKFKAYLYSIAANTCIDMTVSFVAVPDVRAIRDHLYSMFPLKTS